MLSFLGLFRFKGGEFLPGVGSDGTCARESGSRGGNETFGGPGLHFPCFSANYSGKM